MENKKIIDVRSRMEFLEGSVAGSINIHYKKFQITLKKLEISVKQFFASHLEIEVIKQ
jgi:rhodanese-related sulfurtransferase